MKRWIFRIIILVLTAVFLVSGGLVVKYFIESAKQKTQNEELVALVRKEKELLQENVAEEIPHIPQLVEVEGKEGETAQILDIYKPVYERNQDLVGWIQIEGTSVNYPVMQTPDNTDYYLYTDFYHKYSAHGSIYVQEKGNVERPSDNLILYGHNMRDGSMFAPLLGYREKSFWQAHPTVRFDTLTEQGIYEIIAVCITTATVGEGFPFYEFSDASTQKEFDEYVSQAKEIALYDTGVTAQYGDKLITLCTCEYSKTDGRLLVIAKKAEK